MTGLDFLIVAIIKAIYRETPKISLDDLRAIVEKRLETHNDTVQ